MLQIIVVKRSISETTGAFIEGERIIIDETSKKDLRSIISLNTYTIDDVKSVFQSKIITSLSSNFSADTVLYDRVLPYFSLADNLSVLGGSSTNTATVANRRFAGKLDKDRRNNCI